jgi:hypothetical protein
VVSYDIDSRGSRLIVSGPFSKWLHLRLICINGSKFDKKLRVWYIPKCYLEVVKIVITTRLNNLSKEEEGIL